MPVFVLVLLQATSLPFIVTATHIGVLTGRLAPTAAAGPVCAGLVSVLVFPVTATSLGLRDLAPHPLAQPARRSYR